MAHPVYQSVLVLCLTSEEFEVLKWFVNIFIFVLFLIEKCVG